jgi:galactose mutarotase-like enzyme
MTFDEGDASGWDECLPSVAACRVETEAGPAEIPDHGDLWRIEWEKQGLEDEGKNGTSVTNIGKCFSLPLELQRRLELSETAAGWRLDLGYELTNTGEYQVPWSWTAHPLFAVEAGDRIVLPSSIRSLRLEGSGGGRLGKGGDTVGWPLATQADGSTVDLSIAEVADSGIGDKLFAGPLEPAENWCALERTTAGVCVRTTFDAVATPYLGLWVCYGGWPERPGPKQVCVALEPSTAPVDSLAVSGSWSRVLAPGASFSWQMQIEIKRIER